MMKYAILAGINTAIINSLISGTAFFTAVLFYFLFNEKLSKQHFIGIFMLMIAVILVSFSQDKKEVKEGEEKEEEEKVSVLVPVFIALLCCVFYMAISWLSRTV